MQTIYTKSSSLKVRSLSKVLLPVLLSSLQYMQLVTKQTNLNLYSIYKSAKDSEVITDLKCFSTGFMM